MLPFGGLLFVLEGERPPEESQTAEELLGVMREYETLESPFSRAAGLRNGILQEANCAPGVARMR